MSLSRRHEDDDEPVAAGSAHDAALHALEASTPSSASSAGPASSPPAPTPAQAPAQAPAPPLPPPIPSNVSGTAAKSPAPRGWLSSVRRPRTSPGPRASALKRTRLADGDARRDSALTGTANDAPSSPNSLHKAPSLPAIVVQQDGPASAAAASHPDRFSLDSSTPRLDHAANFHGIDLIIPTGTFDDFTSPTHVSFSKRGSMFLGGKKANRRSKQLDLLAEDAAGPSTPPQQLPELAPPTTTHPSPSLRPPSRVSALRKAASYRVLSVDEMMMSRKVRSMYKHGDESAANWDKLDEENASVRNSIADDSSAPATESLLTVEGGGREDSSSFISSTQGSGIAKEPFERAGGAEDWTDLEDVEVDRYGFIVAKRTGSRDGANGDGMDGPEQPQLQRVSTALQLVSAEPRRRRAGRSISRAGPPTRRVSQKSEKPTRSVFSNRTSTTLRTNRSLRNAANKLPHNRERRLLDEASDMLKLPPGLAEVAAQKEGGKAAQVMKAKEVQRDTKWRRMAKLVDSGTDKGGGMLFEFDTKDSRLINRTWKGIPDRWRAAAWWSFLSTSAKRADDSPTDRELIESFYELQAESSAEDMQIDVDVPRTINSHIMFRRRYRGGQRLLFRVLHAMSLYLPDTGYVQGMAPLAATLLCYYEEDKAFVMLVRLWMLRGLEKLYESGFAGLMEALDDFERNWLREGDVKKKLDELGVSPTAWGTRWYLTLFNYSLPFPAQLRVWDVFMLLGDASYSDPASSGSGGDLDVLHATSAALIDATREILLDSDFENVMKVLTSWIPVKDEELLMRVAKAEYRMRKKRANA